MEAADNDYQLLKKHLRELNYPYEFGKDSTGVVSILLNDLIRTTDAFKSVYDKSRELEAQYQKAEDEKDALIGHLRFFETRIREVSSNNPDAKISKAFFKIKFIYIYDVP